MKKTAYDYLKNGVEELTVQDTDYDVEIVNTTLEKLEEDAKKLYIETER